MPDIRMFGLEASRASALASGFWFLEARRSRASTVLTMEAWEGEPLVRPIPIEDDDGVHHPAEGTPLPARANHHRPWLPLAVSGAAVVMLIGAVTFLGAVEYSDAPRTDPRVFSLTTIPSTDTSPAEVLPPTLEETIPGITDRLTLITTDGETLWTLVWDPSFRVPKPYSLTSPSGVSWTTASFDAGGRVMAATGTGPDKNRPRDVWLGPPTQIDHTPDIRDTWSAVWHATEVSRLAFVTVSDDAGSGAVFQLWTTEFDALTNAPSEPNLVAEFDQSTDIVRWDGNGFVMQIGNRTAGLDPAGVEIWRVDGSAHSASPNFVPHGRRTAGGREWSLIDRATGVQVSFTNFDSAATASAANVIAARNSDLFAAATPREAGTTITIFGSKRSVRRILQVEGDPMLYQFTPDATFLILRLPDTNDLVFLDWRSGAVHRFDVPSDHEVLAVDLG